MAKMNDMLVWGAVGVGAVIALDYFANLGIINGIKSALGVNGNSSKVSYYTPRLSNAYIGEAYGLGQQSFSGDYNSIPRTEF